MELNLDDLKPEKICRVCLCDADELKSLKAKLSDEDKTILEAINYVVDINIKLENGLPDKICHDCEIILDLADLFKRRCLDSEDILRQQHNTQELPVTFERKPENCLENASLKNVVDKLLKKEDDLAIYANVTISKRKKGKTNVPKVDPDVIEIDNDEQGTVEDATAIDEYENVEFLEDIDHFDDTETTNLEAKSTKSNKTTAAIGKPGANKTKKDAKYTCDHCGLKYKTTYHLQLHINRKHPVIETFVCDKCGEVYLKQNSLRVHKRRKHPENIGEFECKICAKKFNHLRRLNSHLHHKHTVKIIKYDYTCKKCQRQFKFRRGLRKHVQLWHEKGTHICKECKMKFSDKASFEFHKKEHIRDKQLCTICGRYVSFTAIKSHIQRHQNIKPYQCHVCEKSFITKAEEKIHHRTHTGERKYLCPICGRGFSTASGMMKHRGKHSDARPYRCEYCPKAFKELGILRNHLRTHTGEKPYECPLCEAAFPRSHHLSQHMRRHARDMPDKVAAVDKIWMKPIGRPAILPKDGVIKEPALFPTGLKSEGPLVKPLDEGLAL